MSYIPTEWKTGDIVTAEKLNKLEEGVTSGGGGGGGLLVHIVSPENLGDPVTLDKNWNEINAAVQSGVMPVFIDGGGGMPTCIEVLNIDNEYDVTLLSFDTAEPRALPFVSDSATGVLTYTPEL